jgi:hypothetical protein
MVAGQSGTDHGTRAPERRPYEQRRLYEPSAVPRGGTPCVATPCSPLRRRGPDRERFQQPPGAILAPSEKLGT